MAAGDAAVPVVELSYRRLSDMAGAQVDTIRERLPHLGLDIEHEEGDVVRVEYSPNRPDYSTEYGIGLGLQGILGNETGIIPLRMKPPRWSIQVDDSVAGVRGAVTGVLATGGALDGHSLKQIIAMQEDIHQGLGRGRRRVAIGIHDAGRMEPPISYTTVTGEHSFTPLEHTQEMPILDIMRETKQGMRYGGLVSGQRYPVIMDNTGRVASMPPVINSAHTAISEDTGGIFVDITGHHTMDVERALAVVCITLQAAGFALERVSVSGAGNRTPPLDEREMSVGLDMINGTLGLGMSAGEAAACMERSRLGAHPNGDTIRCVIPPYRFDIMGPMDLVEEAALGYGIDRMEPVPPPGRPPGRAHHTTIQLAALDRIMTGLGYMQTASPVLAGEDAMVRAGMGGGMRVANPKSGAHTMLRTSLLPGLLDTLGRNVHEPYPHRLYETGRVFERYGTVVESLRLGCVTAHKDASYSEIKSTLHAVLRRGLGLEDISTPPADGPTYQPGRAADIWAGGRQVGTLGEVSGDILRAFRLREHTRVAAFEVDVELIFGGLADKGAP